MAKRVSVRFDAMLDFCNLPSTTLHVWPWRRYCVTRRPDAMVALTGALRAAQLPWTSEDGGIWVTAQTLYHALHAQPVLVAAALVDWVDVLVCITIGIASAAVREAAQAQLDALYPPAGGGSGDLAALRERLFFAYKHRFARPASALRYNHIVYGRPDVVAHWAQMTPDADTLAWRAQFMDEREQRYLVMLHHNHKHC